MRNGSATFVCTDDCIRRGILKWFKCQLVNKSLASCHFSFALRRRMLLKVETKMTNLTFTHCCFSCQFLLCSSVTVNHGFYPAKCDHNNILYYILLPPWALDDICSQIIVVRMNACAISTRCIILKIVP